MATLLYRLGRFSARRHKSVLLSWLLLLVLAVAGAASVGGKVDEEFTVPGSESQSALDVLADKMPAASGTSAQLVFQARPGQTLTSSEARGAVARVVTAAGKAPAVITVIDPYAEGTVSEDGRVAVAQVQYAVPEGDLTTADTDGLRSRARAAADPDEIQVVVGGDAYKPRGAHVSAVELVGVVVALVVLLITFGSLLAAGLTLLPAFVALGVGLAGLLAATDVVAVSSTAVTLALMLGLAVGIDYALFVISRHRSQLAEGSDVCESIGRATGTSGSAVVFAGLTVVVAMSGLAVVRIPFVTVMGVAASLTVTVAVAAAVTLIPALLGLVGRRLRPRAIHKTNPTAQMPEPTTVGRRWVGAVTRRPLAVVGLLSVVLGVLAVPATDLRLALPDNSASAPESQERQAYDLVKDHFGAGFNGPLLLTVEPDGSGSAAVSRSDSATGLLRSAETVRADVAKLPGVRAVTPVRTDRAQDLAIVTVFPTTGPTDQATTDLVHALRDGADGWQQRTRTTIAVTGTTAVAIDVSARLGSSLVPFAAVVVGLALLLLLLVFRSVLVPLKAAVGFLLSVGAALGVVVAVFQWGWGDELMGANSVGPVVSFLPVIVMAVLFGLAMDYEVFLVAAIREQYVHNGRRPQAAVRDGFPHSARVVAAAALIMFSVFAAFTTNPSPVVKPMALSLAVGVAIDAFLVRMTLVPAVLTLAGRFAWWLPRGLDRLLPNVDVEGASLPAPAGDSGSAPLERVG
ncbi:MMPL family transporter [Streptomyces sp. NPDC048489]|uniref:MMPL family transporter n=1 Tax=Streptomyces sp. NPDC048489 TaxID=3154504 RepID=UPI003435BF6A